VRAAARLARLGKAQIVILGFRLRIAFARARN
jgi:hypothetical protein